MRRKGNRMLTPDVRVCFHSAAPPRRTATVQKYGPYAANRDATKTEEPRVQLTRSRRHSVPPPPPSSTPPTRADASHAGSIAAASSDDAATAAAEAHLPAFPALDRFLAAKGQNLRERRMQQLQMDAAMIQAQQQQAYPIAAAPLRVDTAAYAQPQFQAAAAPHPYYFSHPLPNPAFAPQPAYVHPPPPSYPPSAAAANAPSAAISSVRSSMLPPVDPEPLSPASLEEVLLIPEVQAHLRELKRQWRKEIEHELRLQQPPRRKAAPAGTDSDAETTTPWDSDHKTSHSRVRFQDAHTATDETSVTADARRKSIEDDDSAEVQQLRDQLIAEQQAHSATMSRLTQLSSARMEEQAAREEEQLKTARNVEQLHEQLRAAEAHASAAQRSLEEERQRHASQLASVQGGSESLVTSLTSKYEALLEKYTSEKLAAAEVAAAHRVDHAQLERVENQLRDAQQQLHSARQQISVLEERLQAAERLQRTESLQWSEKEQHLVHAREAAVGKLEDELERSRAQLQQAHADLRCHVHEQEHLQEQVHELQTKLQEHTRHAEERLQMEEKQKQEQLRFTEQMQGNLELLSRESQSKQQAVASVEGELRTVLHAMEQLKSKSHNKIAQLQHDLESRNAEVDDCKVLLKTMMAEEKLTRTRFNDIKQQLQRAEQQLQQSQATVARLQEEAVRAHSRPVSDASDTRIKTLEHELRISHEIAARLEGEKERLAMRLEDIEEQLRASARRHAEYEKTSQEQAAATAAAAAPPEPDQQLLRSFHELSDKLAIKEKILESLTEQLATEAKSAASLGAEVRALKKSQAELERRGAEADEARRAMQQELRELQEEAMEWANFEDEQDRARTTIDALKADNEKLQKQLSKKQESLSYIESEILGMKSMFERKESETKARFEAQAEELRTDLARARDEAQKLTHQLNERTQQYQYAQNCVHRNEQELRVLIGEVEREKRQRQQLKLQLQALLPEI